LIVTVAVLNVTLARGEGTQGEIPFKLAHGFGIFVHGGIGPLTNLNFLVDTGAVPSVLNQRVASRIGVTGASGSFASLQHENVTAQYVTVDEVHFGSIRAMGLPMVVVDLAPFERLLETRIDAIIGLDMLARQNFSIDYKRHRITLGLSGATQHVMPVEILTLSEAPYWVLPINLGGHTFRVLLDTGADNLVLFAGHTRKSDLNLPKAITTRWAQPLPLTIGDMLLKRQSIVVIDEPSGTLQQIDGVLGPTALGITRIDFDWEHTCLRWDAE
jgi:predicted aspartyl protease